MLALLGSALTVVGLLGVAYAVFRTNVVSRTLELYRAENEALGKALARREEEARRMAERLEAVEAANRVLRETVTGEAAVKALEQEVRQTHNVQLELLRSIHDKVVRS